MAVTVRPLTEIDLPAFLELIQGLADYEKLPGPDAEGRKRLARDAFADPPLFWAAIAERDSRPVGYGVYYLTYSTFSARPTLFVEDIFVLPGERGNGAGKAIMKHLAGEAVRRGCGRMEWNVLDWNEPAQRFYRTLGARILDDWRVVRLTGDALTGLGAS
mgnify:CR=1 FL=1